MGAFFSQIFSLLTAPQGNLVYQLVLVFSIASAMQSAFTQWRSNETSQARRTLLGLTVLMGVQVLLFVVSAFAARAANTSPGPLPVLDRAFAVISIIWITWLWAFPESSGPADAGAALLSFLAIAAASLSLLMWLPRSAQVPFNNSIFDYFWQAASVALILLGGFLLIVRRPSGFVNGLAFLALIFLGHIVHMLVPEPGNYSGVIHLAYLMAFPLLLTLAQRFPSTSAAVPAATTGEEKAAFPQKRYTAEPKTIHALMDLAAESDAPKVSQAITRSVAQTMLADLCFLVYLSDNKNQLEIASGYDLIREENLEGGALNKTAIPMLTSALQRGRALRLPASGTSADLKGLAELLGINTAGSILSVPIVTPEKESLGGVILLSPYSSRSWSAEDQAFLVNLAGSLVPIIQRSQLATRLGQETEKARDDLEAVRSQVEDLEGRNSDLSKQIEIMTLEAEKDASEREELAGLVAAQGQSQQTITELQSQLEAARSTGAQAGTRGQDQLNTALSEAASLRNQLADANQKLVDLAKTGSDRRKSEQAEVIASISQELRQPMSSIIGYTDLLLGESVGILGALQRKFIERIKASTERIGSLIEDMIQLNTLEVGLGDLKPETMDLNMIIDNALAYTSSQVREKNISMHLELPKSVAPVNADREALQQILIHLLQNAGAATPVEGTIGLKVQTTTDNGQGYVMIQVTDSGGGIPEEDLPRVFTRLYRADNVLIQGVGDTGVGLSIAKTLTEAQHGRIWVESERGVGATFNVLLPLVTGSVESRPQKEGQ
jgi:signal transduction histidine kinase